MSTAQQIFAFNFICRGRDRLHNPNWTKRDHIFLSTVHNSAVFHATLAERGFLEHWRIETHTHDGPELEINVSQRLGPVVEATCGSLGQPLSVASGLAQ